MLDGVQDQEVVEVGQGEAAPVPCIEKAHHHRQHVQRAVVELEERRTHRFYCE